MTGLQPGRINPTRRRYSRRPESDSTQSYRDVITTIGSVGEDTTIVNLPPHECSFCHPAATEAGPPLSLVLGYNLYTLFLPQEAGWP